MKRALVSMEEFERLVELEVRKRVAVDYKNIFAEGWSAGWQEGYSEAEIDAEENDWQSD